MLIDSPRLVSPTHVGMDPRHDHRHCYGGVSPTHVGMDRGVVRDLDFRDREPHARGDGPAERRDDHRPRL